MDLYNMPKRKFIVGDKWLSYKIYGGLSSLEDIIKTDLYPLLRKYVDENIIDKFFFVRYIDSDHHLRIRLSLVDNNSFSKIVMDFNKLLGHYVDNRVISKVIIDTYNRELERYGKKSIEYIESLFYVDSEIVLSTLCNNKHRYFLSFNYTNLLLNRFGFSEDEKIKYTASAYKQYKNLLSVDEETDTLLDKKYRNIVKKLTENVNYDFNIDHSLFDLSINKIMDLYKYDELEVDKGKLVGSLIHMHINRLFLSDQNYNELAMYYFLNKLYITNKKKYVHKI